MSFLYLSKSKGTINFICGCNRNCCANTFSFRWRYRRVGIFDGLVKILASWYVQHIESIFLIFTVFSQYQWVFYLQLGYFISLQFTRKSSGKKTFICESLFPCGKWDFSTRKKAFSREGFFPHGKRLSLEKAFFHLKFKWIAVSNAQLQEGVAPAVAGDLLMC